MRDEEGLLHINIELNNSDILDPWGSAREALPETNGKPEKKREKIMKKIEKKKMEGEKKKKKNKKKNEERKKIDKGKYELPVWRGLFCRLICSPCQPLHLHRASPTGKIYN